MNTIYTPKAPEPIGPYSQGKEVNNLLFCSGQIPLDAATGKLIGETIAEQTEKVCQNIGAVLEAGGVTFDHVVKTMCFLVESSDFEEFNQVYAKYFQTAPARSCVFVKALPKGAKLEIEVIAAKA